MTVPNEALEPRALHERLGKLTDRLKTRFEEFERRIGKLEKGMREIGDVANKLGEVGTRLEEALPALEAIAEMESRVSALEKNVPSSPDYTLRTTHVMQDGTMVPVGDGTIEAGPTVPVVEQTFRCLSCGQSSPHKKMDLPVEGNWQCQYCGSTTYYQGNVKE